MDVKLLRMKMLDAGVSQQEIADACGLTRQTVSNYIHGRGSFSTDQAVAICKRLGVDDLKARAEIFLV